MPEDDDKIRNAFVVGPDGEVEERSMPKQIAPVVDSLEKLRDALLKRKENK